MAFGDPIRFSFSVAAVLALFWTCSGCGSAFSASDPPSDAAADDELAAPVLEHDSGLTGDVLEHDASHANDVESARDVAPEVSDAADAEDVGDVGADACWAPNTPPTPAECGCTGVIGPKCFPPCTWQIGPMYCANGRPECFLVPGGC